MQYQNFLCLNATNCRLLDACSNGSFSKIVLSFFINLRNGFSITKKPPLIQPASEAFGFSLKFVTFSLFIFNSPNLAMGFTAVTVANFLCLL